MPKPTDIIVVEDDAALRTDLVDFLNARGLTTRGVGDGAALWVAMACGAPKLLLVDVVLPGDNGLVLVEKARAAGFEGGIVMLSAMTGADAMATGYNNGADVYLTKRTDLKVIEACVRRLLATQGTWVSLAPSVSQANWRLDRTRWLLWAGDESHVKLTGKEFHAMTLLMGSPGQVQARASLTAGTSGPLSKGDERRVDAVISRLRHKVQLETGRTLPVDHVYGEGYVFSDTAEVFGMPAAS